AKPIGPDETAKEARNSERRLSLNEKKLLQVALKDAGHYTGAIDGLYGKGTRASMRRWQEANQYESTGILTTNQRSVLLDEYYVVLSDLGMRLVTDRAAGISIEMPTAVVAFDSYTAPFAHYTSIDDNLGEVHLISQPGDRAALYALYDVMETLSIVPLDGYRKKNRNNFILTGQSDNIISHTQAFLEGGQIKGFTIVWPANRADQADRLIDKMQGSFETNRSVLPRSSSTDIEPGQEMLAGLELRKATAIVSGAFINDAGMVLTTSDISESCERIAVLDETNYTVLSHAPELGLSLLAPKTRVTPIGFATIKASANRINARVAVAGYSFGGTLGSPTLTYGTIAATAGLQGETHLDRLKLAHFASDAGGPVLGSNGEIVGVLNARDTTSDRQLPSDVSFMTDNTALGSFLRQAGVSYTLNVALSNKSGIEIERMARDMSVWISCWE
ncbi:MAG: serine protease, partial [Paracoccaceae bacterium]|nr:serine protease [Paracoccaceae bacterium]